MADQKKRPTAIHIENCDNVTLKNNVGIGDMDLIVAKNSKNITGSGNKIFIPNGAPETPHEAVVRKTHWNYLPWSGNNRYWQCDRLLPWLELAKIKRRRVG